MKRINLTQILAASLVVLSASSIAFANPAAPGSDSGKWTGKSMEQCKAKRAEMRQKFAKELGLNADQQKKIDGLWDEFKTSHKTEFEAMHAQYKELHTMRQNGASEQQIEAKRQEIHKQFAGLKADKEKLHAQIRALLTPEQAKKLDAMRAERGKRHHHHCRGSKDGSKGGSSNSSIDKK